MEEKLEHILNQLDFDEEFEQQVNLRTLVGNESAKMILRAYVDQFFNDRLAGKNPQLVPILLTYQKCSGVHTFARSISNSFASLCFHTVSGTWLSDGVISLHSFIGEGKDETYYIAGDKLSSNVQMQLWKILSERKLFYYDFESSSWQEKQLSGNKLIILSTEKKESISYPLLKQFKIQVNLAKLILSQIDLALKQRVRLLNLKIREDLLGKIAQCCPDDVGKAMEVLAMAHMLNRSHVGDTELITEKHINQALHILNLNNLSK
jgi:hypothetical protein